MKRAFITGITGQDGSYLAELLLGKGYEVHGLVRRASTLNRGRIDHLHHDGNLRLHYGAHGRGGNYSERELATWRRRIAAWRTRRPVFAYLNNDWRGFAVKNARDLRAGLS